MSRRMRSVGSVASDTHVPALDGVRGIAILLVAFGHFVTDGGMESISDLDNFVFDYGGRPCGAAAGRRGGHRPRRSPRPAPPRDGAGVGVRECSPVVDAVIVGNGVHDGADPRRPAA